MAIKDPYRDLVIRLEGLTAELEKAEDTSQKAEAALSIAQAYKELEEARDVRARVSGPLVRRRFELLVGVIVAAALIAGYFLSTLKPVITDIVEDAKRDAEIAQKKSDLQKLDTELTKQENDRVLAELELAKEENDRVRQELDRTRKELINENEKLQVELTQLQEEQKPYVERKEQELQEAKGRGAADVTKLLQRQLDEAREALTSTQQAKQEASVRSRALQLLEKSYPSGRETQPRGIRNNNPVLVAKDKWVGLMEESDMTPLQRAETKFAVFKHPAYGFRAGAHVVLRQQRESQRNLSVLEQLFIWFGNTKAQKDAASRIADHLNVRQDEPIDLADRRKMGVFLTELAKFHNGVQELPYKPDVLDAGLMLAGLEYE